MLLDELKKVQDLDKVALREGSLSMTYSELIDEAHDLGSPEETSLIAENNIKTLIQILRASEHNKSLLLLSSKLPETKLKALLEIDIKKGAPRDAGLFYMSSGSTGKEKLVFQSFENMHVNAKIAGKHQKLSPQSKVASFIKFSHSAGVNMQVLPALLAGAEVSLFKSFHPKFFYDECDYSHTVLVPPQLRLIETKKMKSKFPLIVTGSAPIDHDSFKEFSKKARDLLVVYGLTEIGPFVCYYRGNYKEKESFFYLGEIVPPYEAKLSDESEILIKNGAHGRVFHWKEGGLVEKEQSYIETGDLGKLEGSTLYFKKRKDRVINYGGLMIDPLEIEDALASIEEVDECLCFGRPDISYGEVVCLAYAGTKEETEVLTLLKNELHPRKVPKKIKRYVSLPKSDLKKTNLKSLIEDFKAL